MRSASAFAIYIYMYVYLCVIVSHSVRITSSVLCVSDWCSGVEYGNHKRAHRTFVQWSVEVDAYEHMHVTYSGTVNY